VLASVHTVKVGTTHCFLVFTLPEFDGCVDINKNAMIEETCVLTYNWGDSFKTYLLNGRKLLDKFGVAPTPGSQKILDRETGELIDCDEENCRYGTKYEDIGWVNSAPYLAFGKGWTHS
jgi:hypothetical protein